MYNSMQGFVGEHIVIRKARLSDLDAIHENIYSDAALLDTMFFHISKTREESAERLKRTIAFQNVHAVWFVALKQTDEAIGLCGIYQESEEVYSEAGLAIARKYQGRGYATEMLLLLLDYVFRELGAREFSYYCMSTNAASRNLCRKFGFRYDSTSEKIREYDQKVFQLERYTLKAEAYLK